MIDWSMKEVSMQMDVKEYVNLLYDLKVLERKIAYIFEQRLGISLTRFQIIKYLYEVNVATPKQLSKILEIDGAAITRHINKLEKEGYVDKSRNEANNREVYVRITETSKNKIDQCTEETDISQIIRNKFTDEDLKQLIVLLKKFNNNLILKEVL